MEYLEINDEELSEKFKQWWLSSFKGCVPIQHPADLNRFAILIKCSVDKQNLFNSSILYDFLSNQLKKSNLNKNEIDNIHNAIFLYDFSINHLLI